MRKLLMMALIGASAAAAAQDRQAQTGAPPQRIRSVTLQKGERCPSSTSTEVVVCSTNTEPYRIPKQLRDAGPIPAANQAWANRAETVANVSRVQGGIPDTCSAIGNGGQTGCALQANRAYAEEKRAAKSGGE